MKLNVKKLGKVHKGSFNAIGYVYSKIATYDFCFHHNQAIPLMIVSEISTSTLFIESVLAIAKDEFIASGGRSINRMP